MKGCGGARGGSQARVSQLLSILLCGIWLLLTGWEAQALPAAIDVKSAGGDNGASGLAIAEAFLLNSSTFRFDGIEDSLRLESVRSLLSCPGCYEYVFYFESRLPGYGDRAGLALTPALTPHRAKIVLTNHKVVSGVLDDAWDMMNHLIVDYE